MTVDSNGFLLPLSTVASRYLREAVAAKHYSPIIFMSTCLSRLPSNSKQNICSHLPKSSFSSIIVARYETISCHMLGQI